VNTQIPTLLFPCQPGRPLEIDADFSFEGESATSAGFNFLLFDFDALREGEIAHAFRKIPKTKEPIILLYRGWMLSDTHYAQMETALKDKGYDLLNSTNDYAEAHYLPNAYPKIADHTARTAWVEGNSIEDAWNLYQNQDFCKKEAIIKDYVKSAKYRWREACYIPAHCSRTDFERIFAAFLYEHGPLFEKGIILREFLPLLQKGEDMRGMPIHEEYRLFFLEQKLLIPFPDPLPEWILELPRRFASPFIALDIARGQDDNWWVIEAGDGGVSGLDMRLDMDAFYPALFAHFSAKK
jgi:ATP-grasp domain, R2K clade family 3